MINKQGCGLARKGHGNGVFDTFVHTHGAHVCAHSWWNTACGNKLWDHSVILVYGKALNVKQFYKFRLLTKNSNSFFRISEVVHDNLEGNFNIYIFIIP